MKAFVFEEYGGPEVATLLDQAVPEPSHGQVLVRIRASSINPVDWKIRQGDLKLLTGKKFPKTLGADFAGEVAAVGPGGGGLAVGDKVYGAGISLFKQSGTHAEFAAVAQKLVRRLPANIPFDHAAALPISGLTALNGWRLAGEIRNKQVLVVGATGGVGHFAVQIAHAYGAHITAVCSERNADLARELGADSTLDYAQSDFLTGLDAYDVIFDAYGQTSFLDAKLALSHGGCFASTLPSVGLAAELVWQQLIGGPRVVFANVRANAEDYAEIERLYSRNLLRPVIENKFTLKESGRAYALAESGRTRGKVVIEPDQVLG